MPIDFHLQANRDTYTGRAADTTWHAAITELVDPRAKQVADIGCGGGIYTCAWSQLGAAHVIGVDSSRQMVDAATATVADLPNVTIQHGTATATGLPSESVDIVFERALIHHLPDLTSCFAEAHRILKAGGTYIIQDRTVDDVLVPASPQHLRGYFFAHFPGLLAVEQARRPDPQQVMQTLQTVGFGPVLMQSLWETRQVYATHDALATELRTRKGRSILHELTDAELEELIAYILAQISTAQPIIDQDRWTLWVTKKA